MKLIAITTLFCLVQSNLLFKRQARKHATPTGKVAGPVTSAESEKTDIEGPGIDQVFRTMVRQELFKVFDGMAKSVDSGRPAVIGSPEDSAAILSDAPSKPSPKRPKSKDPKLKRSPKESNLH